MDLADKYRPKTLKEVVGQLAATSLVENWVKEKSVPHALMFTGPSGCGKTTIARILSGVVGCPAVRKNGSYTEVNAADSRGIDTVRELLKSATYRPFTGARSRVYLIDEAQQLTGDAQSALLKILEDFDGRRHCYFMLATTDPGKLKPTIKTRCSEVRVCPMSDGAAKELVVRVAGLEGIGVTQAAVDRIVECCDGSARKALVLLGRCKGLPPKKMADAIIKSDVSAAVFDLVKATMPFAGRPDWELARETLTKLKDENPEEIRALVMANARNTILKENKARATQAAYVIECFEAPFFGGGPVPSALLVRAVFNACLTGGAS